MAHESQKPFDEVVQSDVGLAFLVYPEIVTKLPSSSLLATLFFAMLVFLALGSIFGAFETVITALCDQWPQLRKYKTHLVVLTAILMTVLGLPFTCPGGIHMFSLFNQAAPSWNLVLFALLEVVVVAWIYGCDAFLDHVVEMRGSMNVAMKTYWMLCWRYLTPTVLICLLLFELFNVGNFGFDLKYTYPLAIQILGYAITASSIIWIPIFVLVEKRKSTQQAMWLLRPTAVSRISSNIPTFQSREFIFIFNVGLGASKKLWNRAN